MRWFWIDRFTMMVKGSCAQAVKSVSLSEEHMHDHFPGFPVMPRVLMIEGMAQTAGVLAGYTADFKVNIVLAKIARASFYELVRPGDQIVYDATLVETRPEGHRAEIRATVNGKLVGESEMMLANYRDPDKSEEDQENFVFSENFDILLNTKGIGRQEHETAKPEKPSGPRAFTGTPDTPQQAGLPAGRQGCPDER